MIDALRAVFRKSSARAKTTFAMPPLTVRKPCALAEQADVVLVVGSKNSSNSNRLRRAGAADG
ncbi:hypothetical protein ACHWWK_09660 [Klebsiella pneumoniae]